MNNICNNNFDLILKYIEPYECINLTFISNKIYNHLNNCNYWKTKCKEYSNILKPTIIKLYYNHYNLKCFFCKKNCKDKNYYYNYKTCSNCSSFYIHKNDSLYHLPNLNYFQYPFFLISEYLYHLREYKFKLVISSINTRKKTLEAEFSKKNISIPQNSILCKNYILNRTDLHHKKVCNIICQNIYIYEYTPFKFFRKFFYKVKKYNWYKSQKLALKMVLENNKYPIYYPWQLN